MAVVEVSTVERHSMTVAADFGAANRRFAYGCSCGWMGGARDATKHVRGYRAMLHDGTAVRFEVS